jgi:hypothetical protein
MVQTWRRSSRLDGSQNADVGRLCCEPGGGTTAGGATDAYRSLQMHAACQSKARPLEAPRNASEMPLKCLIYGLCGRPHPKHKFPHRLDIWSDPNQ